MLLYQPNFLKGENLFFFIKMIEIRIGVE